MRERCLRANPRPRRGGRSRSGCDDAPWRRRREFERWERPSGSFPSRFPGGRCRVYFELRHPDFKVFLARSLPITRTHFSGTIHDRMPTCGRCDGGSSRTPAACRDEGETLTAWPDGLDAISPRRGRPADRLSRRISECPGSCRSLRERFSCCWPAKPATRGDIHCSLGQTGAASRPRSTHHPANRPRKRLGGVLRALKNDRLGASRSLQPLLIR